MIRIKIKIKIKIRNRSRIKKVAGNELPGPRPYDTLLPYLPN